MDKRIKVELSEHAWAGIEMGYTSRKVAAVCFSIASAGLCASLRFAPTPALLVSCIVLVPAIATFAWYMIRPDRFVLCYNDEILLLGCERDARMVELINLKEVYVLRNSGDFPDTLLFLYGDDTCWMYSDSLSSVFGRVKVDEFLRTMAQEVSAMVFHVESSDEFARMAMGLERRRATMCRVR